ncbi:protein-tyrosine-phosphatase [Candidatus Magnetomoraceae bacterium gMMP-1]
MIDIHCHILPCLDDGARSLEESLVMARIAIEDGIQTIVATPHSLDGIYTNSLKKINDKISVLRNALIKNNLKINILPGMEVHLCDNLWSRVEKGEAVTINNTNYMLLELPDQLIPPWFRDEIFQLKIRGITPIIVHPERNIIIQRDISILYDAIERGALTQITALSVMGGFGQTAQDCAEKFLQYRLAHIIASDAHSSGNRTPIMSGSVEAASEILENHDEALEMVKTRPEKIISGKVLDIPEPLRKKPFFMSKFLNFFKS